MLHDPKAFAHVARRMRAPAPRWEAGSAPSLPELIGRVEAVLAARCAGAARAP